jgi:hypothetical protein
VRAVVIDPQQQETTMLIERTAYILLTNDGIDQIVEGAAVCDRAVHDLREMGYDVRVIPVWWDEQDKVTYEISVKINDNASIDEIAKYIQPLFGAGTMRPATPAQETTVSTHIDIIPTFEEKTAISIGVIETLSNKKKLTPAQADALLVAKAELMRYARELDRLSRVTGTSFDPSDTPIEGE